jgi:hypothetical protein
VEIVIGRLATDEALRARFSGDPKATLLHLQESGLDLTRRDKALCGTMALWSLIATTPPTASEDRVEGAQT